MQNIEVVKKVSTAPVIGPISVSFKIEVDYTKSLQEMVFEGDYNWVDQNIIECSWIVERQGPTEVEVDVEYFRHSNASLVEVLDSITKEGLRPANFQELCAFAVAFPNEQRHFSIFSLVLETKPELGLYLPYLSYRKKTGRILALPPECHNGMKNYHQGFVWLSYWRFLVARQ